MKRILLLTTICVALLVRMWQLNDNPKGFFCDEASIGINAYTIWHTGGDEYGSRFPVFFRAFGEYKNPVFIYTLSPLVGILGLSEFSVRLGAVLYGCLTVVVVFFLAEIMFGWRVALWSAVFLAVSPWHIHFSRVGFELVSSAFWFCGTLLFLVRSLKNQLYYPLALSFFLLTFLSYNTPKTYLLPFFVLFLIINFRESLALFKSRFFWLSNLAVLLLLLNLIWPNLVNGTFLARWSQVVGADTDLSSGKIFVAYVNHFSPSFLFKFGDIDFPGQSVTRHSVRGIGELYWFQLPLIIASFLSLIYKNGRKNYLVILALLLVYPIGSILTSVSPQATRSFIGVLPFQIMSAIGLVNITDLVKRLRWFGPIVEVVVLIVTCLSLSRYLILLKGYPVYSSDFWGWQYGPREIMNYFLENKDNYDDLYMTGEYNSAEVFLKFYDPENECQKKCSLGDLSRHDPTRRQLFALSPKMLGESGFKNKFRLKRIVRYPDKTTAFVIGEVFEGE